MCSFYMVLDISFGYAIQDSIRTKEFLNALVPLVGETSHWRSMVGWQSTREGGTTMDA